MFDTTKAHSMPTQLESIVILTGATALYATACAAIVKTALPKTPDAIWQKIAAALCTCFVALVAFDEVLHPVSAFAAACATVAVCVCSAAAVALIVHNERKRRLLAIMRKRRSDALIDEYRAAERERNSLPALCAKAARAYDLTRKEETVLVLALQGKNQNDLARELVLSTNTVKSHLRSIYRKVGVHSKQELSAKVLDESLNRNEDAHWENAS